METYFKKLAEELDVKLTEKQILEFFQYKDIMLETNKFLNLTAITEEKEIILKHFIDSLTINKYISADASIIDVGTGAGFPGIPIKILREDVKVTLLDSLNKRVNFLNQVIKELNLVGINAVHGRAEDFGKNPEYREKFDFVTARAVANLTTLSELCLPFIKIGGKFICMKGNAIDELEEAEKAIKILGGKIISKETFNLPDSDIERNIIIIEKANHTPKQYPRKAGTPSKTPLK